MQPALHSKRGLMIFFQVLSVNMKNRWKPNLRMKYLVINVTIVILAGEWWRDVTRLLTKTCRRIAVVNVVITCFCSLVIYPASLKPRFILPLFHSLQLDDVSVRKGLRYIKRKGTFASIRNISIWLRACPGYKIMALRKCLGGGKCILLAPPRFTAITLTAFIIESVWGTGDFFNASVDPVTTRSIGVLWG